MSVSSGGSTTSYIWDRLNRLVGVAFPGGAASSTTYYPGTSLRFQQVDPDGRRTRYVWDPGTSNVLEEIDATGTPAVQYLHGLDMDESLARIASSGTHTFISDQVVSTRALVDGSGAKVNSYTYRAFGEGRSTHETFSNLVRFTGRELDFASRLVYMRGRWLDRNLGRFASQDPIGFAGGVNLYAYVSNDPISKRDPLGLTDPATALVVVSTAVESLGSGGALMATGSAGGGLVLVGASPVLAAAGITVVAGASIVAVDRATQALAKYVYGADPISATTLPNALPQKLIRDMVSRRTRPALDPWLRKVSKCPEQATQVTKDLEWLEERGATDVRVDQSQVDIQGLMRGINRPDVQATLEGTVNGRRVIFEYEGATSPRGPGHIMRSIVNDPNAVVILRRVGR
ncbi:MAG: RHS repeat-associated core domain-containing protein [Candidatus Hydrogenedentes bacterium]|nr:RHS repeat-associated core domain-containing protein [Candidatus Hydrogenedentota bacterium]